MMIIFAIIYSLIIKIKAPLFMKPYLVSDYFLLVTEEGIMKVVNKKLLKNYLIPFEKNLIKNISDLELTSFAHLQNNDGGYIYCRVKKDIFILSNDLNQLIGHITLEEIEFNNAKLISYKSINKKDFLIICFINNDNKIKIIKYEITFKLKLYYFEIKNVVIAEIENGLSLDKGISCEMMFSSGYSYNLLTCFVESEELKSIVAMAFDIEDQLSIKYSKKCNNQNKGAYFIKTALSTSDKKCLICYKQSINNFQCMFYNSESKEFSESFDLFYNSIEYNFDVIYLKSKNEFYVHFTTNTTSFNFYLMKFYDDYNANIMNRNYECFQIYNLSNCSFKTSSFLIYYKNDLIEFTTCKSNKNNDDNYYFYINEFNYLCNNQFTNESNQLPIYSLNPSTLPYLDFAEDFTEDFKEDFIDFTHFTQSSQLEKILEFYNDEDIMKSKTNLSKEELENNLDNILELIEIGKNYEINGNNYNASITPINLLNPSKSAFIDLTVCEEILRKHYNLSKIELLTIFQIEIDKNDKQALTDQVEYAVYNNKKQKLNLSYCDDIQIQIKYNIKDYTHLNTTMIKYYADLGIDIFNRQDSFFNDLCYPFSISNADIILKDRLLDIYQNYSLCDNECKYKEIDIEKMSVTCSCQVKTEIETKVYKPILAKIIENSFKYSNFGVIKCYKLVFSVDDKLNNLGFFIFLIFSICHLPLFIYYFKNRIKSIQVYVYKEMQKNNYISKIKNPIRKGKKSKTTKKEIKDVLSSINNNSSSLFNKKFQENNTLYLETKIKRKRKRNNKKKGIFFNFDKRLTSETKSNINKVKYHRSNIKYKTSNINIFNINNTINIKKKSSKNQLNSKKK